MKVILTTADARKAISLKATVKNAVRDGEVRAWEYTKDSNDLDIISHKAKQYANSTDKSVVFVLSREANKVIFTPDFWEGNDEPEERVVCNHIGKLTGMLLTYFQDEFVAFEISKED